MREVSRLFASNIADSLLGGPSRTFATRRWYVAGHYGLGRFTGPGVTPFPQSLRSRTGQRYATPASFIERARLLHANRKPLRLKTPAHENPGRLGE